MRPEGDADARSATTIDHAIDRIGEPVNLVGDCQGGWLATNHPAGSQPAVQPWSMISGAPLKAAPFGPSRKETVAATSPGSINRLIG
jgi:hypothetical protein